MSRELWRRRPREEEKHGEWGGDGPDGAGQLKSCK